MICTGCQHDRPADWFAPKRRRCRLCRNADKRELRQRGHKPTAEQNRRWFLRHEYGIELEDYERMLHAQGGVCAICKEPSPFDLRVDHCHTSKHVRGLLCTTCNPGLGYFGDDPARLRAAADYLEQHGALE
jgi:hypothetical protein